MPCCPPIPQPRSSSAGLFSPAARWPWGQPAGCQSHHRSPPGSPAHPWALALGTGKGGSAHTPGPGGSHIGTGRAGLQVWAGSWLWEEEWTRDMIPGPQVFDTPPLPLDVTYHPLPLALASCSLFHILFSLHLPQGISISWDTPVPPFCLVLSFLSFPNLPSITIIVMMLATIY